MVKAVQSEELPIEASICSPGLLVGEDVGDICVINKNVRYVTKGRDKRRLLCHNEWFCSNLAVCAQINQLPFAVIKHTSGDLMFGSQFIDGEVPYWYMGNDLLSASEDISRITAFDFFIHNVDRHLNNFFAVREKSGRLRMYSFDYSRAWLQNGFPPPNMPLPLDCNTVRAIRTMQNIQQGIIKKVPAFEALDKIADLNMTAIERVIANQPLDWLTKIECDAILDWWNAGEAKKRVQSVKAALLNGHFF